MAENLWPYLTSPVRVAAVRDTLLAISNSTSALDGFSKLVSQIIKVPVALVSLLEDQRQCYVGQSGLPLPLSEVREVTMEHSMCKFVVESGEPLLITNAPEDPRVRDHAIVRDFGVIAYAGYPIRVSTGELIGTLCVVDFVERNWSDWEREQLEAFSIAAIIAINSDIEAFNRRSNELRMLRMEKMNALGSFSGVIAHDFNNLLTIIMGNTYLLQKRVADEHKPMVTRINDVVTKSQSLIRQLLTFMREEQTSNAERCHVDASGVVEEMGNLLGQLVGSSITCQVCVKDPNLTIALEKSRFEQILMNLVVNARDALPEGGTIDIELSALHLAEPLKLKQYDLPCGDYACLHVQDNGQGIPQEIQDKIFTPYFTTKPADRGTGLGLATISGIVRAQKGAIDLVSESGQGTCFKIYIPLAQTSAEALA